jgi:hypothetical protein
MSRLTGLRGKSVMVEVIEQILSFMTPPEMARAACVSREWRQAAACPRLWRAALVSAFGEPAASAAAETVDDEEGGCWRAAFLRLRCGDPLAVPVGNRALCKTCRQLLWRAAAAAARCGGTSEPHDMLWLTPGQVVRYMLDVRRLRRCSDDDSDDSDKDHDYTSTSSGDDTLS